MVSILLGICNSKLLKSFATWSFEFKDCDIANILHDQSTCTLNILHNQITCTLKNLDLLI
uniref:Uncharacterized protein n=1 Tax=Manihot esculenta TaxID=3983 RepID=A0A2C9VRW6_MANES